MYPLPGFACIAVSGPERFSFLQGQVTCDMRRAEQGEILLGAHLNLQGRIEASFLVFPQNERVLLLLPDSQAHYLQALLQRYILFAKAELNAVTAALPYLLWPTEAGPEGDAYELVQGNNLFVGITDPDGADLLLKRYPPGTEEEAIAIMHRNGLLLVDEPQRGQFLPQELNYEQIDGVSFNKGCYKGQEVVARLHFKGQVKQRLIGFYCEGAASAGAAAVDSSGKKCGTLVHTTTTSSGTLGCALLRVSDWESNSIFLEQNDGPQLRLLPPPYAIT